MREGVGEDVKSMLAAALRPVGSTTGPPWRSEPVGWTHAGAGMGCNLTVEEWEI